MAKDKLTEYDATAANNTVVGDVNLAENSCLPSDLNNAVREVMSHQKEAFGAGTPLYVDQTNNRVYVGATSGSNPLVVNGTAQATAFVGDGSALTGISAGATGGGSDQVFYENGQNVTADYTISDGKNAMSAGPITINLGVTVTVGSGETYTVV